ncbi:MAG: hypothetical protein ACI4KR_01510 [Ruminiclostridium sp.]
MKKILALLVSAAVIIAVAGCGSDKPAETTTTAAETTTTAAETTTVETTTEETTTAEETTAAETTTEEAATEETTAPAEGEASEGNEGYEIMMAAFKEKAPHYYEYARYAYKFPVEMTMNFLNTEDFSIIQSGIIAISENIDIAMEMSMPGVASSRIVIADGYMYIISDEEKQIIYQQLPEDQMKQTKEQMAASVNNQTWDTATLEVETTEEELNGVTYGVEIIKDSANEAKVYFDKDSGAVKYLYSEGQYIEIVAVTDQVSDKLFEVPEDYTSMDMATAMGGAAE